MAYRRRDEDLAYGEDHARDHGPDNTGAEGERGIFGGRVSQRLFGGQQQHPPQGSRPAQPTASSSNAGGMSFVFDKLHGAVHSIGSEIKERLSGPDENAAPSQQSGQSTAQAAPAQPAAAQNQHRFQSFAPLRQQNETKWYVDGCSYMWAVSVALEQARESIWILDWWLSPELYLRRPPAKNEQYRVDRLLEAAASRGVKVNIIVYKEVTQALTLSSAHTKHALEKLHPNIAVFRHPDHLPDRQTLQSSFLSSIQNMSFSAAKLAALPGDSLKAIYGMNDGVILYWAHHEKLCLIDGEVAFMGGLDLCYGRWDTNSHPIADAHPGDLERIVFPGQDFNNARMMDFQQVDHWENNKLDRTQSSRMGWSDISLCLKGPVVQDLKNHFSQRWNFIYKEKYNVRKDDRYSLLPSPDDFGGGSQYQQFQPPPTQQYRGVDDEDQDRGFGRDDYNEESGERGLFGATRPRGLRDKLYSRVNEGLQRVDQHNWGGYHGHHQDQDPEHQKPRGSTCQITRSSAKWSHGITTERSIQNAYCEIIKNSQHFVYIENQFFITATSDLQKPVKNKVGAAIVERILRAARNGEQYKMMVMMPAVPAFAGDLKGDDALGTRAIMEFQYDSINRGGNSIYEAIAKAGVNPMDYIRFYNLRSYDRINASGAMAAAEKQSGVSYEQAREGYDAAYDARAQGGARDTYQAYRPPQPASAGYGQAPAYELDAGSTAAYEMDAGYNAGPKQDRYDQYQQGASQIGDRKGLGSGRWDSVCECYMLGGEDIRNVPWEGGGMDEIDAFVSEELYIHSKLLIADDRIVICGSANLNDRSQMGDHDSEIAVIIEDPSEVQSSMAGRPWRASRFAASLRRQIFRKHLGLLKHQIMDQPDQNFEPVGVPNAYDWDSPEDRQVVDPASEEFQRFWNWRAKTNTDAFAQVFHPVPYDGVRTWKQYDEYYSRFFAEQKDKDPKKNKPAKYKWGHVISENFAPGEQGAREVKEVLSTIKGTLVEMPLLFLKDEDIAKEGLGLNAFTEEVYT